MALPLLRNGYVWIALAAFFWSLIGVISRLCLAAGASPMEIAFWRALVGCLCFLAQAAWAGQLCIRLRDAVIFFLFGIWGVGIFFGATQFAIELSGAATAVVLLYTSPIWVALFAHLLFRERISARKLCAIAVAVLGTTLVCFSGGSLGEQRSLAGIALGLLTGLCYATHYPFYRWWETRYSTAAIYGFMLAGGVTALAVSTPVRLDYGADVWLVLLVLGVSTTYLAYACYGQGLRRISLVRAAVTCHLEPILSTFWVWLFWNENFTLAGWLGCFLVLSAVLILSADGKRE